MAACSAIDRRNRLAVIACPSHVMRCGPLSSVGVISVRAELVVKMRSGSVRVLVLRVLPGRSVSVCVGEAVGALDSYYTVCVRAGPIED